MELGTSGGVAEMLQRIVDAKDQPTIIKFFKEFILKAGAEPDAVRGLIEVGLPAGLAFQLQDDLLNLVGDADAQGRCV